jgi:hypothetical protein
MSNDTWLVAYIEDENGQKDFMQFDNEEELRYFLSVHEECKLLMVTPGGER